MRYTFREECKKKVGKKGKKNVKLEGLTFLDKQTEHAVRDRIVDNESLDTRRHKRGAMGGLQIKETAAAGRDGCGSA